MQPDLQLLDLVNSTFRPHAAIEDPAAFKGRMKEQREIHEALNSPGLHVAIVGERGAGKTSLANIATYNRKTIKAFCKKSYTFADVCRIIMLGFGEQFPEQFEFNAENNTIRRQGLSFRADRIGSAELLRFLPSDPHLCIIVDEVDSLGRGEPTLMLGELCKEISTHRPNITLILVGIAETAAELLAGHISNVRNLQQIQLDRMSDEELRSIIHHGEGRLNIRFGPEVISQLVMISDRTPFFVHIIATRTARAAIERCSDIVTLDDLNKGISGAAESCRVELGGHYDRALASDTLDTVHQEILEALAQMEARSVPKQRLCSQVNLTAREANKPERTPQQIGRILKRLTSPVCGQILTQDTSNLIRFTAPLMRGYVKLRVGR